MANEIDDLNAEIERLQEEAIAERDELENDNNDDESGEHNANDSSKIDDDDLDSSGEEDDNESDDSGKEDESKEGSDDDESGEQHSDGLEFEPITVTIDNSKVTLDSKEEVEKYIETQNRKTQSKRYSEIEETVAQAGLSKEDLVLLADIKAGKVGALKTLADKAKLDLADAEDFEGEYTPEFEAKVKTDLDLVIDNISSDAELVPKFTEIMNEIPQYFIDVVSSNAGDLQQFAAHVKSGLAQELIPLAKKEAALNGGSLLENYIKLGEAKAAEKVANADTKSAKKSNSSKRNISEKEKRLRQRAGADNDENRGGGSGSLSVDDIWNMSPEDRAKIDLRELD